MRGSHIGSLASAVVAVAAIASSTHGFGRNSVVDLTLEAAATLAVAERGGGRREPVL